MFEVPLTMHVGVLIGKLTENTSEIVQEVPVLLTSSILVPSSDALAGNFLSRLDMQKSSYSDIWKLQYVSQTS